jgi:hypothetical protein
MPAMYKKELPIKNTKQQQNKLKANKQQGSKII